MEQVADVARQRTAVTWLRMTQLYVTSPRERVLLEFLARRLEDHAPVVALKALTTEEYVACRRCRSIPENIPVVWPCHEARALLAHVDELCDV